MLKIYKTKPPRVLAWKAGTYEPQCAGIQSQIQYVLVDYTTPGILPSRPGSKVALVLSHTICNILYLKMITYLFLTS